MVVAATLLFVPLHPAGAGPLVNGDFADGVDLAGWLLTPVNAATDEPTDDFARPATGGAFQITLEQTFTLPATPARLAFDFAFSTSISSINAVPAGIFPDSFTVSLVAAGGDWLDILAVDVGGTVPDPSDGIEAIAGALPIDVDLDPTVTIPGFAPLGGFSTSGRISLLLPAAVRDREATLYFDLFDESDGAATIAAIDNVSVEPVAVPAPATLGLLLVGLAVAGIARRRRSPGLAPMLERGS